MDVEQADWFPDGQTYAELAEELAAAKAEIERLRSALEVYADGCDATETTTCGFSGNQCCMTARAALEKP